MNYPGMEGRGVSEPVTAQTAGATRMPQLQSGDVLRDFIREERQRREEAFGAAHEAIEVFREGVGRGDSFHTTFVEVDGAPVERRAVLQTFTFPGLGPICRLMVNDEGTDPRDFGKRKLLIRDFMVSTCAKAFSSQVTEMNRSWAASNWGKLSENTGPFLEKRSDYVRIINGTQYAPHLPRVGGYPTTPFESYHRRQRLEEFTEVLGSLSIATYEPGIAVGDYF